MNIPTPLQNAENTAISAVIDAESNRPQRYSIQTNTQCRTEILLACRTCFASAENKTQFSACMKGIRALVAEISATPKTDEIFLQGAELSLLSVMEEKP